MGTRRQINKVKTVENVRLDKVDESVLRKAYRVAQKAHDLMSKPPMSLPGESTLDLEKLVETTVLWFRASTPADELCDCSVCGGDSDARLDCCPFCGTTGVSEVANEIPEQPAEPALVKTTSKETKAKAAAKKAAKPAPVEDADEVPPSEPEPAEQPEPEDNADDEPESGVEVIDKSVALVDDLDEAVTKIHEYKLAATKNIWEMADLIRQVHVGELWRGRLGPKGAVKYKSFQQFCKAELDMTYSHAKRLIDVANKFPKEVIQKLGVAKCAVMITLPPDQRNHLARNAENKSTSELSAEARALRNGESVAMPAGALTVAMAPGVVELVMKARPKANAKRSSDKAAKSLADDPLAIEELPNNVHVSYALMHNKAGELVLRIDRRRVNVTDVFAKES